MTFSYGEDLTDANDYVRFHTGDTDSDGYFMSDELITSLVAVEGSNNAAVIAGLKYIISQLSRPDFRADWLQVSNHEARKGYEALLDEKRRDFGQNTRSASAVVTYRRDSYQDSGVDYDGV